MFNSIRGTPLVKHVAGLLCILFVLIANSGCSEFNVKRLAIGSTPALATRADIRIVTERPDPNPRAGTTNSKVLCAEPSPDVALALSRALKADAHATTPAGVAAGLTGGYQTSQAAITLAGRTSAVVALRDGLFRACEAYSNGVIGRNSYALILSQYGDLLVTLILGDSGSANDAGGYTVSTTTTVKDPAVDSATKDKPSVAPAAGAAAATPAAPPTATKPAPAPAAPAAPAANAKTEELIGAVYRPGASGVLGAMPTVTLASTTVGTAAVKGASIPTKPLVGKKTRQVKTPVKVEPAGNKPAAPTPTVATTVEQKATTPAEAIAKAYFEGERDRLVKAMFVVCAAEAEQRRGGTVVFPDTTAAAGYFDKLCVLNLNVLAHLVDLPQPSRKP